MENKRATGTAYEKKAAEYLKENGYDIIECNFRCRYGEIDIIAKDEKTLVFAEVKYRSSLRYGMPYEAVNRGKQRKIMLTAEYYRMKNNVSANTNCRFDVISILGNEIEHIKNAFGGWS
ncbi:YraN family protein [Lachnospiraceae bacterium HCP1S3_C3]|nr:YraN family protein [Lachnospiraceae bacterium]MDD6857460.1 YraN family protein [Lachnospiraceae bacterium]